MKKPSEIIIEKAFKNRETIISKSPWEEAIIEYLDERFEEQQNIIKQSYGNSKTSTQSNQKED